MSQVVGSMVVHIGWRKTSAYSLPTSQAKHLPHPRDATSGETVDSLYVYKDLASATRQNGCSKLDVSGNVNK